MPDIKPKTLQRFFLFVLFVSGSAGLLFGGVPSSCGGEEFSLQETTLSEQEDSLGGLGNGNAAVALLDPYAARFKLLSQYKTEGPCKASEEAVHAPSAAALGLIKEGREKAKAGTRGSGADYSIPVVFHNVWEEECDLDDDEYCFLGGTASLCPDGDCETQADRAIRILKEQFEFDTSHIEFHRAIDPETNQPYPVQEQNGQCEPDDPDDPNCSLGLYDHITKNENDGGAHYSGLYATKNIPNALNIYIGECLGHSGSRCNPGLNGFAVFPWSPQHRGVAITQEAFFSRDDVGPINYSTLAHEIGHFLGLFHVWKKASGADDYEKVVYYREDGTECTDDDEGCNRANEGDKITDTEAAPAERFIPRYYDGTDSTNANTDPMHCLFTGTKGEISEDGEILTISGPVASQINTDRDGRHYGTRDFDQNSDETYTIPLIDGTYETVPPVKNFLANSNVWMCRNLGCDDAEECDTSEGYTPEQFAVAHATLETPEWNIMGCTDSEHLGGSFYNPRALIPCTSESHPGYGDCAEEANDTDSNCCCSAPPIVGCTDPGNFHAGESHTNFEPQATQACDNGGGVNDCCINVKWDIASIAEEVTPFGSNSGSSPFRAQTLIINSADDLKGAQSMTLDFSIPETLNNLPDYIDGNIEYRFTLRKVIDAPWRYESGDYWDFIRLHVFSIIDDKTTGIDGTGLHFADYFNGTEPEAAKTLLLKHLESNPQMDLGDTLDQPLEKYLYKTENGECPCGEGECESSNWRSEWGPYPENCWAGPFTHMGEKTEWYQLAFYAWTTDDDGSSQTVSGYSGGFTMMAYYEDEGAIPHPDKDCQGLCLGEHNMYNEDGVCQESERFVLTNSQEQECEFSMTTEHDLGLKTLNQFEDGAGDSCMDDADCSGSLTCVNDTCIEDANQNNIEIEINQQKIDMVLDNNFYESFWNGAESRTLIYLVNDTNCSQNSLYNNNPDIETYSWEHFGDSKSQQDLYSVNGHYSGYCDDDNLCHAARDSYAQYYPYQNFPCDSSLSSPEKHDPCRILKPGQSYHIAFEQRGMYHPCKSVDNWSTNSFEIKFSNRTCMSGGPTCAADEVCTPYSCTFGAELCDSSHNGCNDFDTNPETISYCRESGNDADNSALVDTYFCNCQPGFERDENGTCVEIDGCSDNPCVHGTCTDNAPPSNSYTCDCDTGWHGNSCTICAFGWTGNECEIQLPTCNADENGMNACGIKQFWECEIIDQEAVCTDKFYCVFDESTSNGNPYYLDPEWGCQGGFSNDWQYASCEDQVGGPPICTDIFDRCVNNGYINCSAGEVCIDGEVNNYECYGGDINLDGAINAQDAVLLVNHILDIMLDLNEEEQGRADLVVDGNIDVMDVVALIQNILATASD